MTKVVYTILEENHPENITLIEVCAGYFMPHSNEVCTNDFVVACQCLQDVQNKPENQMTKVVYTIQSILPRLNCRAA